MFRLMMLILMLGLLAFGTPAEAQSEGREIPMLVSAEWLQEHLGEPGLVVVQIDQRRDGYDTGHIPGAHFLQYSRIAGTVENTPVELLSVEELREAFASVGFVDGVRIVLYGAPLSAARAWMTLDYLGVSDRAAMLDGGIDAWRAASYAVSTDETGAPGHAAEALTVNPEPARIIDAATVLARSEDPTAVLIDARPIAEYTGDDNGQNGRFLAGHIPGARHLHWEDLIHSTEDPRLLPADQLRERFESVGAADGRDVLVYCTVGMRASMAYFVSRMLDYDTYLYDGSWADWSARNLPVETGPDPAAN